MNSEGQLPILKYTINNETSSCIINSPDFKVGRNKNNNLFVNAEGVSRNHFSIVYKNSTYYIKDLGSTNGIKLNGQVVKESKLTNGDTIEIVDLIFSFFK